MPSKEIGYWLIDNCFRLKGHEFPAETEVRGTIKELWQALQDVK